MHLENLLNNREELEIVESLYSSSHRAQEMTVYFATINSFLTFNVFKYSKKFHLTLPLQFWQLMPCLIHDFCFTLRIYRWPEEITLITSMEERIYSVFCITVTKYISLLSEAYVMKCRNY